MRYAKYIAALIVFATTLSCTFNSLDEQIGCMDDDGCVEVHARITNYSDCAVESRSAKLPEEARVSSMALAIFPITEGEIQDCIYYDYEVGQKVNFTVDRNKPPFNEGFDDKACAMFVFSNTPNNAEKMGIGKSLAEFKSHVLAVSESYYADADFTGLPDTGFPMIGSLGDNISSEGDGKTFILKPGIKTNENPNSLPLVDNVPSDLLNVPMKSLYAKFSFAITIDPVQVVPGNSQSFTMTSYTLHNIPSKVDFDSGTNSESDVINKTFVINDNSVTMEGGSGEGAINFSFYVPERYFTPGTLAEEYKYPFDPSKKPELRQRYKPDLVKGQTATYVTISGEYLDHNARTWNISYNIYLGGDNYGNFDIVRNSHYINNIIIRGIQNSANQTDAGNTIAIDHRVNTNTSDDGWPIIENLRRATLLDSHFEVRPLRIRAKDGKSAKKVDVSVQSISDEGPVPDWIRLEHKNSSDDDDIYLSNGKRKFFTYNLVSGKNQNDEEDLTNSLKESGKSVSFTSRDENDCVWVYVDQCDEVYDFNTNEGKQPRSAKIVITVDDKSVEYIINQSKLYPISVTGEDVVISGSDENWSWTKAIVTRNYYIESYEEYLYNYDAEDTYENEVTFIEGMKWGLEDLQLSYLYNTVLVKEDAQNNNNVSGLLGYNSKALETLNENIKNQLNNHYDFYVGRHDYSIKTPNPPSVRSGLTFCKNIIAKANDSDDADHHIGVLELNQQPKSAVEYCYNKNKRNSDGTINPEDVVWYLPAIDEIEDVMLGAYGAFDGVFQEQDYWSCQPSYHRCFLFWSQGYGFLWWAETAAGNEDYYIDNTTHARSTRATFAGYKDGVAQYSYNPSGVVVPENKELTMTGQTTYTGVVQGGYYQWVNWRTSANTSTPDTSTYTIESVDGDNQYKADSDYNYEDWRYEGGVIPGFGELQEDGSMERTTMNRVRCLRKL